MKLRIIIITLCLTFLGHHFEIEAKRGPRRKRAYNCSAKYQKAHTRFEKGRYGDVQSRLSDMKYNCNGHPVYDSLLYLLGRAYMLGKKPQEGKVEFQQLTRDFPESPFFVETRYRIAQCSYLTSASWDRDQTETRQAIRELNLFLDRYPDSGFADSAKADLAACREKLAKKDFMSASFYKKIEEFESAVVYYRVVINDHPETSYVPHAKLAMAESLLKINQNSEARSILDDLIDTKGVAPAIKEKALDLQDKLIRAR
ncbi:MAG: outer membrane protein assembly factor BamD [Chitinivibrionales bacterium]|nr:outer membrane protein assembly factor BamD [Chitinivibrionales bacterium]